MFHNLNNLNDLKLRQSIKEKMLKNGSSRLTEVTQEELEYIIRSNDMVNLIKEVDAELSKKSTNDTSDFLTRGQPAQEEGLAKMAGYEPPRKMTLAEAAKPLMSYLAENYCDETIALVGAGGVEVVHQVDQYME